MQKEKVIPFNFIPDKGGRTLKLGGANYMLMNDAMYTFYERSMGDFSDFFLAIRDKKKILGCKCTKCGMVRVPPFVTHCPDCNFAPTTRVEVGQVGKLLSTPPITYFANALFLDKAPFGRGRAVLKGADTAMSVMLYTTTGILTPGIFNRGTEVKIIFKDDRMGEICDIFAVPTSELTRAQIAKNGLLESELKGSSPCSSTTATSNSRTRNSNRPISSSPAKTRATCSTAFFTKARSLIQSSRKNFG